MIDLWLVVIYNNIRQRSLCMIQLVPPKIDSPFKRGMPKKIISLYLPKETIEYIDMLAQTSGLKRNSFLSQFFALHFQQRPLKGDQQK